MDGSPDSGAILDQSDPAAITLWGMAKHSLTSSSTKHIILHYRLETHCMQIYKHQGLINKLFTRAQFGTRLNNIKSDNCECTSQWRIANTVSLQQLHSQHEEDQCDACSYQCFVSSGYMRFIISSVRYMHFIIVLPWTTISCLTFSVILFSH